MPAKKKAAKKKPAAKKSTVKRTAAKKTTAKKKVKSTSASKAKAVSTSLKAVKVGSSPLTKTELFLSISEATGVAKKDVVAVFNCLGEVIGQHVKQKGPQLFTLPGLLKVKVVRKAATKARKGINPFTGEEMMFKAKPARNVVKILALKKLKEMAK